MLAREIRANDEVHQAIALEDKDNCHGGGVGIRNANNTIEKKSK